jgi:SAM-dependent methyltransferase
VSTNLRRAFIQKFLDISQKKILEIGVLDTPTFNKDESDVFYMDWFSREELYSMHHKTKPHRAEKLVDVDYVIKEKNFAHKINSKFDLAIANHVIEHIPDTIRWLENISFLLKNDGYLFMAIPHKEYTFDKIRPVTSLAQIIRNYDEDLEIPNVYQVFEQLYMYRPIKAGDVWNNEYEHLLDRKRFNPKQALESAKKEVSGKKYVDVHCHIFDYNSFLCLHQDLYSMGYIDLALTGSKDVEKPGNEFFVILKKTN